MTKALLTIDYQRIVQQDSDEVEKLFRASTELGFFYVKVPHDIDPTSLFTLAEELFQLPLDLKMNYAMDGKNGIYFGYKPAGAMFTDRKGTPDTMEFWNISKDEILLQDHTNYPQPIMHLKPMIKEYMKRSHEITLTLLEALSKKLSLHPSVLPNLHRLMEPSGDQLRLTKSTMYPNQHRMLDELALGAHTDFGSITLLFNRSGGLQVWTAEDQWMDVPPLPGHAIVNLGDAMVKLSDGILKSNIHRVVVVPELSEVVHRYSVVYLVRPENAVLMKSLMVDGHEATNDEPVLTAKAWIAKRVMAFQSVNYKDEKSYNFSRGTEEQREIYPSDNYTCKTMTEA